MFKNLVNMFILQLVIIVLLVIYIIYLHYYLASYKKGAARLAKGVEILLEDE